MNDDPIYADAFGGKYPVCTEKDKVAIEEAYKKASDWLNSEQGKKEDAIVQTECSCAIIARLLKGEASYTDMVVIGLQMAATIYRRKMIGAALLGMVESAQDAEASIMPSLSTDKPKKEWIN